MRSPQPPIPKPAKSSAPPESHVRPGCEILAISAGADAARLALRPCRKAAWFCYAPLAGFYSAVDTLMNSAWLHDLDITWRGFLSRARPHVRTGHITPMGPIFSPSANFFCSSLNEA